MTVGGGPDDGLAIVAPRYGVDSLADVLPGVLSALGVPGSVDPIGLCAGPLAGVRHVAVLLVDGLGHHQIPLALPHAPVLADVISGRVDHSWTRAITSGFPSTTPVSLTTLGTGVGPGEHGIVGIRVRVPETDEVMELLRWSGRPDPRTWQPRHTQFDVAVAAGVDAHVVSRPEFADTGLTLAANRGGRFRGAGDADALASQMLAVLDGPRPSLVYGYHPDLDKAGHLHGVDSPEWRDAVAVVDRLVTRLIAGLPAASALVVTSDHGQLNVPQEHRFDLDADARLRAGVRFAAGEPRVRYLHTVPGAAEDVAAAWRELLGDAVLVMSRAQAVAEGWFGPVPESHLQRIGDVVVACQSSYVVVASRTERPIEANMVAYHGSATGLEMMVPLLVVRAD